MYDVLVVGGGVMGASVAYHTALSDPSLRVCVVERDTSYAHASAMLSAGGIRQQFSLPVNIQLSLYGVDFLRRLGEELLVPGAPPPDVQFKEHGYLFLASAQGEATLRRNQAAQGVSWTRLLSPEALQRRFPWLNVDGVALGCVGERSEGWFDPWALLSALRAKAAHLGVDFVSANVEGLEVEPDEADAGGIRVRAAIVRGADGHRQTLGAGALVNAAGAFAADVVRFCGDGDMVAPLPVAARKRCVFSVHCDAAVTHGALPPLGATGLVVDPSGVWFRPEGAPGHFLCGVSPPAHRGDPDCAGVADLEVVDHTIFDDVIWPALYARCEAFASLKVRSSWAGFYEYNTFDQNAIIGRHPHVANMVLCNGFSGHGLQQSPAAGRAVAEIITGSAQTVDVSSLGFERVLRGEPVYEQNIV